jgi:hypothetical protein
MLGYIIYVYRGIYNLIRDPLALLLIPLWYIDQCFRRIRLRFTSIEKLGGIKEELIKDERSTWPKSDISLTLPARRLRFGDIALTEFLESLLNMTKNIEKIEVLLKIDTDDDLIFFYKIKKKYKKRINLCFFISERGSGYAHVNKYLFELSKLRSPTSRVWMNQAEDALFVLKDWDFVLLSAIGVLPHEFFITSDTTFEETISICGPNPVEPTPVYWIRGDLFPIIGNGISACTEEIAAKYPNWTSLGNDFNTPGFIGDLLKRLWELHGLNLHIRTPTLSIENATPFFGGWVGKKELLRSDGLINFFKDENQAIRDEMVNLIKQKYDEEINRLEKR